MCSSQCYSVLASVPLHNPFRYSLTLKESNKTTKQLHTFGYTEKRLTPKCFLQACVDLCRAVGAALPLFPLREQHKSPRRVMEVVWYHSAPMKMIFQHHAPECSLLTKVKLKKKKMHEEIKGNFSFTSSTSPHDFLLFNTAFV